MAINKELLKGNAQTIVLKLLSRQDMYGYQLAQELTKVSEGGFELTEGTLYPLLHALETDMAVESYWDDSKGGRKRKFYKITTRGKKLLKQKSEEWESFRLAMEMVLGSKRISL